MMDAERENKEDRRRRSKWLTTLLDGDLTVSTDPPQSHARMHAELQMAGQAWMEEDRSTHPPPRKPDTFAKKSHRRSPKRRTNRTSCSSSSSVHGPFLIAAGVLVLMMI
jgi:hypothetical protein